MNPSLDDFLNKARESGKTDPEIKDLLVKAGWDSGMVEAGLKSQPELVVPPPPANQAMPAVMPPQNQTIKPIAVQSYFSTVGFDYTVMFVSLWITAISFGATLDILIESAFGNSDYSGMSAFFAAMLIVGLPVFVWFFTSIRRAESKDPGIKKDVYRHQAVQLTLF